MYTFSEKRPRAVASAREISYDRGKGGDGVIEILEQTPGLVVCIKPVGVHAQGEAEADLPALSEAAAGLRDLSGPPARSGGGRCEVVFRRLRPRQQSFRRRLPGERFKGVPGSAGAISGAGGGGSFPIFCSTTASKTRPTLSQRAKGRQKASLSYRVVAEADGLCLVHVRLHTGRTHQIRVQFASRGMPLVGDGKYGSRKNAASPALWSYALTLPMGGAIARIRALPEAAGVWAPFEQALRMLT